MVVCDGKGKVVRQICTQIIRWTFCDHQQEFDQQFKGAAIIGDQHFEYVALFVEECSFFTSLGGKKQSARMVEELESDESRKHLVEEEEVVQQE